MKRTYLILFTCLYIASCSSTQKRHESVEHFVTHIKEDGTKIFSYNLIVTGPKNSNIERSKRGNDSKRGNKGIGNKRGSQGRNRGGIKNRSGHSDYKIKMKERFMQKLKKTLFEMNFCHKGYSKIESSFDREMSQFKGQCEEKANKEDRIKFSNQ